MKNVAIIGSGLSGLLCGNLLAKKGHKVTIFESHGTPGGYTAGFWREGFYFESGTLAFESTPSVNKAMEDVGLKVRELLRDAFGDLFELDSRLWQTLIPLLIRPGRLTSDYLQGKRYPLDLLIDIEGAAVV